MNTFKKSAVKKQISLLLIGCLLWTGIPTPCSAMPIASRPPLDLSAWGNVSYGNALAGLGLETLLRDPSKKLVVYLEEAHGNNSSQLNIAELLRAMTKAARIEEPWVALEGTEKGEIDHRVLSLFPDAKIRAQAAEAFLKIGEMDGADLFTARDNPHAKHFGVDDAAMVQRNQAAYRAFQTKRGQTKVLMQKMRGALEAVKLKVYNNDLISLDRLTRGLEKNEHDFLKRSSFLEEFRKRLDLPLSRYLHFGNFLNFQKKEASIPFSRVNREWQAYSSRNAIDPQALNRITELFQRAPESFSDYPLLQQWAELSRDKEKLEVRNILSDINNLTEDLWQALLKYPEARDVYEIDRTLSFYEKLFDFSLTPQDDKIYRKDPKAYDGSRAIEKLQRYSFLIPQTSLRPQTSEASILTDAANQALEFYRWARERNQPLEENLLELINRSPSQKLFFLGGGFHTEELAKALEKKGIALAVVTPHIENREGEENYWRIMSGEAPAELMWPEPLKSPDSVKVRKRIFFEKGPGLVAATLLAAAPELAQPYLHILQGVYPETHWAALTNPSAIPSLRAEMRTQASLKSLGSVSFEKNLGDSGFYNLKKFYLDLMEKIKASAAQYPSLNMDQLESYMRAYIEFLGTRFTNEAKSRGDESLKTNLKSGLEGKEVSLFSYERIMKTAPTPKLENWTGLNLSIGLDFFSSQASHGNGFAELLFILTLNNWFTRPVMKLIDNKATASIGTENLLRELLISKGSDGQILINWNDEQKAKFLETAKDNMPTAAVFKSQHRDKAVREVDIFLEELRRGFGFVGAATVNRSMSLSPATIMPGGDSEGDFSVSSAFVPSAKDPGADWLGKIFDSVTLEKEPEKASQSVGYGWIKGSGAFGIVAEGPNPNIETQRIIIKLMVPPPGSSNGFTEDALERLKREAAGLARMNGKFAPKVLDKRIVRWQVSDSGRLTLLEKKLGLEAYRGQTIPVAILTMALAEETRLDHYIESLRDKEKGKTKKVTQLLLELTRAVAFMHKQGILHRDLKPANVFVKPESENPFEKVTLVDFGLAHDRAQRNTITTQSQSATAAGKESSPAAIASTPTDPFAATAIVVREADKGSDSPASDGELTKAGTVFGTPAFLGTNPMPENDSIRSFYAAEGKTEAPDLWALGAMFYLILTGKYPHLTSPDEPRQDLSIILSNWRGQYKDPREVNREISPSQQYIILKLMATLQPQMPLPVKNQLLEGEKIAQRFDAQWEPLTRYASSGEVLKDVEALAAGRPLPSAPSRFLWGKKWKIWQWIQAVLDVIPLLNKISRNYEIHTVRAPEKVLALNKAQITVYKKTHPAIKKVIPLKERKHFFKTRVFFWVAAGAAAGAGVLAALVASVWFLMIPYIAELLRPKTNPPADSQTSVSKKEQEIPTPIEKIEKPEPFQWGLNFFNHTNVYSIDKPLNPEGKMVPEGSLLSIYSSSVIPASGTKDKITVFTRPGEENGYSVAWMSVEGVKIPIAKNRRLEMSLEVKLENELIKKDGTVIRIGDSKNIGTIIFGFQDPEARKAIGLVEVNGAGQKIVVTKHSFPFSFRGDDEEGHDAAIRKGYASAGQIVRTTLEGIPGSFRTYTVVKPAKGELDPVTGQPSDGVTAHLTIEGVPGSIGSFPLEETNNANVIFYMSGHHGGAFFGNPMVKVSDPVADTAEAKPVKDSVPAAPVQPDQTKPPLIRNEIRMNREAHPDLPVSKREILSILARAARNPEAQGLILLPYQPELIEQLMNIDTHVAHKTPLAFVGAPDVIRTAQAKFGERLRKIYGIGLLSSDQDFSKLKAGDPVLLNLRKQAAVQLGQSRVLKGKMILLNDTFTPVSPRYQKGPRDIEYLQYAEAERFITDRTYREAYLLAAELLANDFQFQGFLTRHGDIFSLRPAFVDFFSSYLEQYRRVSAAA